MEGWHYIVSLLGDGTAVGFFMYKEGPLNKVNVFFIFVLHQPTLIRLYNVCGSAGGEATRFDQEMVAEDHYREGKKHPNQILVAVFL